ncbi:M23 family metallopeptidase [Maribacter aestuarii]|uniref:M23 family metallopeptidase n=1 Tax=Maribacter aestuarii TaxID=1130723 RepID=UPI00248AD914|nr:M23 family metallopeptidase [Maribacter aestuarii]
MERILLLSLFTFTLVLIYPQKEDRYTALGHFEKSTPTLKKTDSIIFTNGFDFPVGKPDANGYYNAQPFGMNNHLGEDWNGNGGGNTDFGDPIYASANGYISFSKNIGGGWGKVIRIKHYMENGEIYESLYAHCDSILVEKNQFVYKGAKIGTIGNAGGMYFAHLHFEIRNDVNLPIGQGYSNDTEGYLDPTKFIRQHRK